MLTLLDVDAWTPHKVSAWLLGLFDDTEWLNSENIIKNNINGKELLLMTGHDLMKLGVDKVDRQEGVLEAIDNLRFHNYSIGKMTLQSYLLMIGCKSNSLTACLELESFIPTINGNHAPSTKDNIIVSNGHYGSVTKQIVSLDTLCAVSDIVETVKQAADMLRQRPFILMKDFKSIRSLLLAISIELASTAQRDHFAVTPNDVIKKKCKELSDYCDLIVEGTRDPLLIEPFRLVTVRIRKTPTESSLGLLVESNINTNAHTISKILPLSPAKKTNKLDTGDQIIQFNQYIVGWSPKNVQKLLAIAPTKYDDIILMVKKRPLDCSL